MKRIPVKSSNIKSIGYDVKAFILEIEFNGSGAVYHYKHVEPITVLNLIFADSIGKNFAQIIKTKYPFMKGEYSG